MARILAVTAVAAERDAVLAGLPAGGRNPECAVSTYRLRRAPTGAGELTCVAAGVGPVAAAVCAATLLAVDRRYDAVFSVGVGGGFPGRAPVGSLVVTDRVVFADLGADSPEGFLPANELGLGEVSTRLPAGPVAATARRVGAVAATTIGPVLTVCTVTGTDERAAILVARHDPAAEAMEGGGVLAAATAHGVPFTELRAISNPVGRRDRSSWSLPEALSLLGRAVATLLDDRLIT